MTQRVVVAAAVLDESGRLLAARRTAPPALCGLWELPGGKVEAGETEPDALRRELREELGVEVIVGEFVGRWPLDRGFALHVYLAATTSGVPMPLADHDAIRWLEPEMWTELDWVPADRPAITRLSRQRNA